MGFVIIWKTNYKKHIAASEILFGMVIYSLIRYSCVLYVIVLYTFVVWYGMVVWCAYYEKYDAAGRV